MPYADPTKQKAFYRAYYTSHKKSWRAYNYKSGMNQAKSARALVNEAKNRPCADCGFTYPFYVMQFDHRDPSTKSFTIGSSVTRGLGINAYKNEIAKCDVVCANCHAQRTHNQRELKLFKNTKYLGETK